MECFVSIQLRTFNLKSIVYLNVLAYHNISISSWHTLADKHFVNVLIKGLSPLPRTSRVYTVAQAVCSQSTDCLGGSSRLCQSRSWRHHTWDTGGDGMGTGGDGMGTGSGCLYIKILASFQDHLGLGRRQWTISHWYLSSLVKVATLLSYELVMWRNHRECPQISQIRNMLLQVLHTRIVCHCAGGFLGPYYYAPISQIENELPWLFEGYLLGPVGIPGGNFVRTITARCRLLLLSQETSSQGSSVCRENDYVVNLQSGLCRREQNRPERTGRTQQLS